ncbi:topoisomerase I damage affected protein 11 [Zygosaccharomyces mellis]|uniref:Topoisomerase I damage affected protein 11 n=1 Tax=Zygosaccharomyces mellis TaxID=42258 RepID=A0A4C2E4A8_9SACH|nr:topoisomerase I damage affected protein 11 [Zygosaccharomyces mellis]
MNKFDEFVEATDRELHVDTSTRGSAINVTSPGSSNGSTSSPKSPSEEVLSRKEVKMKQFTPKKLNYQDHPLKDSTSGGLLPTSARGSKSSTINRRKSLLQPIVAPQTPDKSGPSWRSNTDSPNGSLNRQRSPSGTSIHSRSSSQSFILDSAFDASLQNLANKELELLEAKRHIEELKKQLQSEEYSYQKRVEELRELKSEVSSSLQINTQQQHQQQQQQQQQQIQGYDKRRDGHVRDNSRSTNSGTGSSSVWSKPLAFFNQFDQIIQHELERSLHWDDTPDDKIMRPEPYEGAAGVQHSQLRQPQLGSLNSNSQSIDSNNNTDNTNVNNSGNFNNRNNSNDRNSKNIWSFFNDVKTGLLGIEEEEETSQRTTVGSAKGDDGVKEFKTAKRTKDPVEMTDFQSKDQINH